MNAPVIPTIKCFLNFQWINNITWDEALCSYIVILKLIQSRSIFQNMERQELDTWNSLSINMEKWDWGL